MPPTNSGCWSSSVTPTSCRGLLVARAGRVPAWILPVALAWGSTLISAVAYFSADRPSPLIVFYLWIFLYSSYFFTRRWAIVQIVYVGRRLRGRACRCGHRSAALAWWVVGMGALARHLGAHLDDALPGRIADRAALRRRADRSADQAAQPARVPRAARPRARAIAAQRRGDERAGRRHRSLQGGQRPPRAPGRRRRADAASPR